jgi:hypothetical protein
MSETEYVATDEEKEEAARELADGFAAFQNGLAKCASLNVDIPAELEKLGLDIPPFVAMMFQQGTE